MKWFKNLSKDARVAIVSSGAFFIMIVALVAGIGGSAPTNNQSNPNGDEPASSLSAPNDEPQEEVEMLTVTEPIAFQSTTQQDSNLASGTTQVAVTGVNGEKTIIYRVTKRDGTETSREKISESVTKQPVDQITKVGTKTTAASSGSNCDPNYSPCIPNVSYDLDCPDIGFTVRVIGTDRHRLDRDRDGYGCE